MKIGRIEVGVGMRFPTLPWFDHNFMWVNLMKTQKDGLYLDHICCKVCITLFDSFQYQTNEAQQLLHRTQDVTPIPTDCTRKKCGRRGRRLWAPVLDRKLSRTRNEKQGVAVCWDAYIALVWVGVLLETCQKKSPKFFFCAFGRVFWRISGRWKM